MRDLCESSGGSSISNRSATSNSLSGISQASRPTNAMSPPRNVGLASPVIATGTTTPVNAPSHSSQPPWMPSTPQRSLTRMLAEVDERMKETQFNSQIPDHEMFDTIPSASQPVTIHNHQMMPPSQQMTMTTQSFATPNHSTARGAPLRTSWDGKLTEPMMLSLISDDSFLDEVCP